MITPYRWSHLQDDPTADPFLCYPDFGVPLCARDFEDQVVPVALEQLLGHCIHHQWGDNAFIVHLMCDASPTCQT